MKMSWRWPFVFTTAAFGGGGSVNGTVSVTVDGIVGFADGVVTGAGVGAAVVVVVTGLGCGCGAGVGAWVVGAGAGFVAVEVVVDCDGVDCDGPGAEISARNGSLNARLE